MHAPSFLLCFLLLSGLITRAQLGQDTVVLIDKILSRYTDSSPGAQLAISRNGQLVYSSARGLADLEHGVPLGTTSRIEAGSVSKQFTAAAILLLEQEGKLSLDDDVRQYIPELPDYGSVITIRHLMQHTSGLKDWGSIAELSGWPRGTKAYTNDDALEIITRQKTLNNKPGDEYIYSNSGYTLLTHIVQRVSGMTHAAFTKKYIFEPAGMEHTEWRDSYRRVVKDRAIAYSRNGGHYVTTMPNEDTYGHGGLLTTAEDLLRWNAFYLSGRLGGLSLLQKQTATLPLNGGKKNTYAAGLFVDEEKGVKVITHSGATAGYRANLDHFPQLGLSIAWLSNVAQADWGTTPQEVKALFVPHTPASLPEASLAATIGLHNFVPYAGAYRDSRTGAGLRLWVSDTALVVEPHGKLVPLSVNAAMGGRTKVLFQAVPRALTLVLPSGDTVRYEGVDTANVSGKLLTEYAGTYVSAETGSAMIVQVKEGKLFYQTKTSAAETGLVPVYKDGFTFSGGNLFFERDKKGKISRLLISIPRARKVSFSRAL